ncbi:MAG: exopolysaccharide biosynthesis polyprenyl glycosylphosphotransferase [Sphingomonadales bacterium]|nr:exopolysaccharide biosynthesis polyprenyl glycosylphosphotransferase [Sphingomonadales bacterium]
MYGLSLLVNILSISASLGFVVVFGDPSGYRTGVTTVALLVPLYVMFAVAREVQSVETLRNRSLGLRRAMGAYVGSVLLLVLGLFFLKVQDLSRLAFAMTVASGGAFLVVGEGLLSMIARVVLGPFPTAEVLILDGARARSVNGMEVIDIARLGLSPDLGKPEMIDAISRIIAPFDRVVIACRPENRRAWSTFLKGSDVGGEILIDRALLDGAIAIGSCGDQDTLIISRGPLGVASRLSKRVFDIVIASGLLLFLSPLLVATAIAIKLDSTGPIFFKQLRVGLGNRMFWILKFRSMHAMLADADGGVSASRNDARITKVGRFIRRTSIDELPQLINVLRGEMSMVGPRPHALGSLAGDALFWEVTDQYWIRHALKPGITGLAQIRGLRGATDNPQELEQRVRCDLEYLSNWSLVEDFMILMRTFRVIMHDKAY